jgi:hypothetical protein
MLFQNLYFRFKAEINDGTVNKVIATGVITDGGKFTICWESGRGKTLQEALHAMPADNEHNKHKEFFESIKALQNFDTCVDLTHQVEIYTENGIEIWLLGKYGARLPGFLWIDENDKSIGIMISGKSAEAMILQTLHDIDEARKKSPEIFL